MNVAIVILLFFLIVSESKKHIMNVFQDDRSYIHLTSFGFSEKGSLFVNVSQLKKPMKRIQYWLTLDVTLRRTSQMFPPGNEKTSEFCKKLNDYLDPGVGIVTFKLDFENKIVETQRHGDKLKNLSINSTHLAHSINNNFTATSNQSSASNHNFDEIFNGSTTFAMQSEDNKTFLFYFYVNITCPNEVGLYTLTFHNCQPQGVNMSVYMEEKNIGSYLSLGEIPLPVLYFSLFLVYLILGSIWFFILCKSKEEVFKIHYLMLSLMYIKSISLLFHGINYRFIELNGEQEEAFAILFYIIYLMKGILMFVTIILIGAGWTFIKHILSEKEKKIFAIVIPLQILTNVAHIILFETEEGQTTYSIWYHIFILVDLVCCGAILFPVVWSIRHLQQASSVDGKAAINLKKLKIFRHFYIMVVFYIYFTRVIILLLNYTIPFQYIWLDELLVELATLSFFVTTGYKFRPASNNPYLRVSLSDDEESEIEIVTKSGILETVTRVHYKPKNVSEQERPILGCEEDPEEQD